VLSTSTEEMNLKRPTNILAIIAIGVGAWWCWITLLYPISRIWTTGASDPIPWLGLFVIPMMIIPGAMALFCGIGLLKEVTKERIKGSVGALAIFGTIWTAGKELWSREFEKSIDAVTCNADHVYVALDASYPYEDAESIRRLDVANGVDSKPKGIPEPFLVQALVWSPEIKALCALEHEALWIYSADLLTVANRVPYSGRLPIVTSDGKCVLLAERTGSCTLIDLKAGSIDHIHGPPNKSWDNLVAIDAPFLSNAFHSSGGSFIRVIDNSWATGRIYFHSTPKDTGIEKDSKNGHAVAAVHWATQRLAVSGTEKNLLLFSVTGTALGEVRGATTDRTYAISFSPSGTKIATLSSDGRIKVFNAP